MPDTIYRMPAEWEKQSMIWLGWPHNRADWPGKFGPVPWAFAEMIRYISYSQRVGLLVKDEVRRREAVDALEDVGIDLSRVDIVMQPTNRGWLRDCGPIFVHRGDTKALVALDWRFNAWAKYSNWQKDNAVPEGLCDLLNIERVQPHWPLHQKTKRLVLEGGAIDVNGAGTLITTEECLLSPDIQVRNAGFTRQDYEACFAYWLGAKHVIWLEKGIIGDDTHGHVDDIARFVNPTTVVCAVEKDPGDANYALLQVNLARLKNATDQDGTRLTVIELPMPRPLFFEGHRLPASYANFLITNQYVLVPTFNDPADRVALSILAECFPEREVVGIHAVDLVWGLGTLHCLTQQMPL
ncbi:MAG: agmatine deiminase family protein [Rickettsiales bacterium]|nr:agmatine deiminase family protein [Rickettsiales bacterium]